MPRFNSLFASARLSPQFPPAGVIAATWRVSVEGIALLPGGHGEQALVRMAGGRAMVLKRLRREGLTPERAEVTFAAVAAVARDEAVDVAAPLPQRGDRDFLLEWKGRLYYLMRFVDGARPSFKSAEDVTAVMAALGRLHRAAGRLAGAPGAKPGSSASPQLVNLGELCERIIAAKYDVIIGVMRPPAGMGMRLLACGLDAITAQVAAARALAPRAKSPDARVRPILGHGDTHENNFLILESRAPEADATPGPDGKPPHRAAHLDVESFDVRAAVEDLIVPLHYLGHYTRWAPAGLRRALAAYERTRTLGAGERAFLAAHLTLPRHWRRAAKSLLKQGGGLSDVNTWLKWRRGLRDLGRQRQCVEELFSGGKK